MSVEVRPLSGDALQAALADLARLRIAIFADYPYLYDGSEAYERDYLADFAAAPESVLIAALDGGAIVGAATATPLMRQDEEVLAPFERAGIDPAGVFYFGESVLLPQYRGQGIGHAFFERREAAAREWGARQSAFCAVIRPPDHPQRPAGYVALDAFWHGRGYAPVDGLTGTLAWREHGESSDVAKPMQYWMRDL